MSDGWGNVPHDERETLASGFGELLNRRRRSRDWTVAELARRSGTSATHIYRLQRGERRPRPSLIANLARALDPDDWENLSAELEDAAGDSLRSDTTRGQRRRARQEERARKALERLPDLRKRLERQLAKAQETQARIDRRRAAEPTDADILLQVAELDRRAAEQQAQFELQRWERDQALMHGLTPEQQYALRTGRSAVRTFAERPLQFEDEHDG